MTQTTCPDWIAILTGKIGARSAEVGALAPLFEKSSTELKIIKKNCKNVKAKYKYWH